jgi:hypothetical protein
MCIPFNFFGLGPGGCLGDSCVLEPWVEPVVCILCIKKGKFSGSLFLCENFVLTNRYCGLVVAARYVLS